MTGGVATVGLAIPARKTDIDLAIDMPRRIDALSGRCLTIVVVVAAIAVDPLIDDMLGMFTGKRQLFAVRLVIMAA